MGLGAAATAVGKFLAANWLEATMLASTVGTGVAQAVESRNTRKDQAEANRRTEQMASAQAPANTVEQKTEDYEHSMGAVRKSMKTRYQSSTGKSATV